MCFVMIDAYERTIQRIGECLTGLESNDQRGRKSGTLSGRDRVEISGRDSSPLECFARERKKIPQMFARGEFGNHTAILSVEFDLR